MSTITGKINVGKLVHVVQEVRGQSGKMKAMIIPIEKNHLFEGKEGNMYLDIIAFDLKNPQDDQTHLVKQSLPKNVREAMSDDERNNQPILGSLNVNFGGGEGSSGNASPGKVYDEADDLPF